MAQARTSTCLILLLAVLALAAFCFAGPHEIAAAAQAHGGIVGDLVGQLKREDDETEVEQLREDAPVTREEREEAHEQAEAAAIQVAEQPEGETS